MNIDATVDGTRNKTGFGQVVRDSEGMFVASKCLLKLGVHLPNEVEAIAISEVLTQTKMNQMECVQAKTDALSVV